VRNGPFDDGESREAPLSRAVLRTLTYVRLPFLLRPVTFETSRPAPHGHAAAGRVESCVAAGAIVCSLAHRVGRGSTRNVCERRSGDHAHASVR